MSRWLARPSPAEAGEDKLERILNAVGAPVLLAAAQAASDRVRAALVTIVRANGSTPQRVGAKMLVYEDGRTVGTIGGGCYENDACLKVREVLRDGRPRLVRYDLNDDVAADNGLICGGQMDVFIEPIVPAAALYVIGAGHVGYHVARLGAMLGFAATVVDDRVKFANDERFPDAAVVVDDIPTWLAANPPAANGYVVVVTRGHRQDLDALRVLIGQNVKYLGLIGSRAKISRLYEVLIAEGVPAERLGAVHAPIGLDIGAVTPEEIAVAIVAELVAVRSGKLDADTAAEAGVVRSMRWSRQGIDVPSRDSS